MNKEFSQIVAVFLTHQVQKIENGVITPKSGELPIICHAAHFEITPQQIQSPAGTLIDQSHTLYISRLAPAQADILKIKRSAVVQLNQNTDFPSTIGSLRFPAQITYVPSLNDATLIIESKQPIHL